MGDFLAELFDQFDPEEQARIREAESSTEERIAQGTAAVRDRLRASGSRNASDWVQQPELDARADAAGILFIAYVNALWRGTDAARAESIHHFLTKVEKLIVPVLTRYGWEGKRLIEELHWLCRTTAFKQPTSTAGTSSSTGDSATDSPQGTDHPSGPTKASDALEQAETKTGQSAAADGSTIYFQPPAILDFPDSWIERRRRNADSKATCARYNGRNGSEAARQEELLKDAREWAKAALTELVSEVHDVLELKERVVKQTWDQFLPPNQYYSDSRRYREFESALWEEGWPSLEDRAISTIVASQERAAAAAAKAQSIRGGRPSRHEIEKLANDTFAVAHDHTAVKEGVLSLKRQRVEMETTAAKTPQSQSKAERAKRKRRDLLQKLSEDDPNYELGKRFYVKSWVDSYGLYADSLAGRVSLAGIVDGCVKRFDQAARAQVALQDSTSIPEKCQELDLMAKKAIRLVGKALARQSNRLGKAEIAAATAEYSRRVTEIAERSKRRILKKELARSSTEATGAKAPATVSAASKANVAGRRLVARLKKLKLESNLSWQTIAKESGVSNRWLFDIVSGSAPSVECRKTIGDYFSNVLERRIRF